MDKDYIIFQEDGLFGAKNQRGEVIIQPQYMEMQTLVPEKRGSPLWIISDFVSKIPENPAVYFLWPTGKRFCGRAYTHSVLF